MSNKLESRIAALEKQRPPGRTFLVWKGSERHREAEANAQPGDKITIISWMGRDRIDSQKV